MISRDDLKKIIENLNNLDEFDSIIDELEKTIGEFENNGDSESIELEVWRHKYDELLEKYRMRFADAVLETKKEVEDAVKNTVEKAVEEIVDVNIVDLDFDGSTES